MPANGIPNGNGALVRAPISAGGQVAAIVPHNFEDAFRIANALAASGITPFKRPEECLAVIMAGAELGLTPFAATQSFAVINGRVSIWGDGMLGVVRAAGVKVQETHSGTIEDQDFVATCKAIRPDGEVIERSFSWADAKRAGLIGKQGPWAQYPQRMIPMRARSWCLRDGCADILRGIRMAEEAQDIPPEDVRVIDSTGDHDQRPAEERDPRVGKYGVIGGAPARDIYDDLAQRMSDSEDADALERVQSEAEKANLSSNRMFALAEHYEACKEALENGREPPSPPRFAKAPEPSPFESLRAEGEELATVEALKAWRAKLTPETLGKCSAKEREDLKAIHAAAKQRVTKSAGVGGASSEGAGLAGESGGAANSAGAEAPPASSSPFETLRFEGLAISKLKTKRARGDAFEAWNERRDAAKYELSDEEAAQLARIAGDIGREFGA